MRLYFDGFDLDPEACQLLREGVAVQLEPRALDLLCYLAVRPGQLLRKEELLAQVWRAHSLSDGVLSNTIGKLRRALGQDAHEQTPIETVRGRGYRWRAIARNSAESAQAPATDPVPLTIRSDPPPIASRNNPFVGRSAVLELLTSAIESAARGTGQLVLVVGEAGIGKTRTLEQLSERARARGFRVWSGMAHDGAGAPAYWPWVEVLRAAHTDLTTGVWTQHLPVEPRALALLVPELIASTAASSGDVHAARFRLFDEMTRFITSVSSATPLLIVLDDLHWADVATLELLAYAASACASRPIMLATGFRDREAASSSLHVTALRRLERLGARIALDGLALHEVAELVSALQDDANVDTQLSEALHRRTQGNPFFLRQIMALLAQRATPADAQSVMSTGLPAAVQGVVLQRLAGLNAVGQRVLSAAAVIGQEFDINLLAGVLGLTLDEILMAMEPARALGIIVRRSDAPHVVGFTHTLLREVLYAELDWSRCGALHAKLAHALATQSLNHDSRQLGEVARHYLSAVPAELDGCVRYCSLAADAAREASGFEAAAELLSRALSKVASEAGREQTCCDLMLMLGFDQLCSGDLDAAWQTLERGAALAHDIGNAELLTGFACRLADWLELGGDESQTRTRLDQALASIAHESWALRAALLARQAKLNYQLPSEERHAMLDAAQELAERCGQPAVLIDVAFCRASLREPTRTHETRAAAARYLALTREYPAHCTSIRDQLRRASAEVTEYFAALTACDLDAADHALARWSAAAKQFQVMAFGTVVELARAGRALAAGRLDELEASLPRAIEDANAYGVPALGWYLYAILLADARGQLQNWNTIDLPETNDKLRPRSSYHRLVQCVWSAWFYARTGRLAAARDCLEMISASQLACMPVMFGDLGLMCLLAETYHALDDTDGARRLRSQLAPHAALNAVGVLAESRGCVAHYVGVLAEMLNDTSEAISQLEHAELLQQQLRMPLQLERTRALLAQCRASQHALQPATTS